MANHDPVAASDKNHASRIQQDTGSGSSVSKEDDELVLKNARRKVDKRLLLWYSFVYLIMRIHVSNITNTAIINIEQGTGIKKQLGNLTSQQWAWALSISSKLDEAAKKCAHTQSYPYLAFEPLATLMLKKFSPSVWMSRIMLTWVGSLC
jgi:hypothetical protein